jgi:hypothetical protein
MIYFITDTYLKRVTAIQNTVDVNDLVPFIQTVAEMTVQPILGTYFFNDLLTKYNNQTLSADETTLVEYLQPIIAWQTCAEGVIILSRQLKNKGLQSQFGDYSQSADLKDVAFYSDHYNMKSKFYVNRLVTYLKDYKDLYPNYTSKLNKDSNIEPTTPTDSFNDSIMFI